jgi:hypothetical protein
LNLRAHTDKGEKGILQGGCKQELGMRRTEEDGDGKRGVLVGVATEMMAGSL